MNRNKNGFTQLAKVCTDSKTGIRTFIKKQYNLTNFIHAETLLKILQDKNYYKFKEFESYR